MSEKTGTSPITGTFGIDLATADQEARIRVSRNIGPKAVFDLDGTLVDIHGELRDWAHGHRTDYDVFHELVQDAPPNPYVVDTLRALWDTGWEIMIVTARSSIYYVPTCQWLAKHSIPFHTLSMRPTDHYGTDYDVKRGMLLNKIVPHGGKPSYPQLAFEDNPTIVDLWEEFGIPTVTVPGWGT